MTKAELYMIQQALRLSDGGLAHYLEVAKDTVRSWKKPKGNPVPDWVEGELWELREKIVLVADAISQDFEDQFQNDSANHPKVYIYKSNDWWKAQRDEILGHILPGAEQHQRAVQMALDNSDHLEPVVFWDHNWAKI